MTYSKGIITVFGADMEGSAGNKTTLGITSFNMISAGMTNSFTVTEKENSEGNTVGAVASDVRDDMMLTFYPVPAQTEAGFKGITLPPILTVITLSQMTPSGGLSVSGYIPTSVLGTYNYVGGGRMDFTQNGLMTMTLPLRRFNGAALA